MNEKPRAARGPLAKLLRVRVGERRDATYFSSLFLVLGAGIAVGRGSADVLFLKRYGVEYLPAVYGALSVFMAVAAMAYAAFADRLAAERLLQVLLGLLTAALVAGVAIMQFPDFLLGYPGYYLIYEVAGELLLLHAAFYAWQNFESQQAKRLLPLFLAAGQVGAICGGIFVAAAIRPIGADGLVAAWAVLAAIAFWMVRRHHQRRGASRFYRARRIAGGLHAALDQLREGMRYTRESVLVRASSLALFGMVVSFYILSYSVSRIYNAAFGSEESLGAFLGGLSAATSAAAIVIQLFVTGRMIERLGIQRVNLVYPLANVGAFAGLAIAFALPAALLGSVVREVLLPAVRRPVRSLFFNALPDKVQGRARALSMAIVLPLGLAVASAILLAAQAGGAAIHVVLAGLVAALAYVAAALRMNAAYVRTMVSSVGERVFMRRAAQAGSLDELVEGVSHPDDGIALASARQLVAGFPEHATSVLLARFATAQPATRDAFLRMLAPLATPELARTCETLLDGAEPRLRATALGVLFELADPRHAALVPAALEHAHPRVRAAGVQGALRLGSSAERAGAFAVWRQMLESDQPEELLAGLELVERFPPLDMFEAVVAVLRSENAAVQKFALRALARMPVGLHPALERHLRILLQSADWEVRQAAVGCLKFLAEDVRETLALVSLEDSHPSVRARAIEALEADEDESTNVLSSLLLAGAGSPRAQHAMLTALHGRGLATSVFLEVAELRAEDAAAIEAFMAGLDSAQLREPAVVLLRTVLEERRRQFIELSLESLRGTPDADGIDIVRAALFSRDSRQQANGLEILRNLGDRRLARTLGDLIEGTSSRRAGPDSRAPDFPRVFAWCAARPDPWLRRCARMAESAMRDTRPTHG